MVNITLLRSVNQLRNSLPDDFPVNSMVAGHWRRTYTGDPPRDRGRPQHAPPEWSPALPVIEGVTRRSGGVPLFVEEVTRLLLERGEQGGCS